MFAPRMINMFVTRSIPGMGQCYWCLTEHSGKELLTYLLPDMPLACRAATKVLHFCLFLAICSTVPQMLFIILISPSTVRLHVLFALPHLRFPSGDQCSDIISIFSFFFFLGMLCSKYFANYIVYRFLLWRPQKRQWAIKERPFQVGEGRPMLFFFQIQSPNNLTMQFHDNIVLNKEKFDAVKHAIYKAPQTRRSSRPISAETALPRLQSESRLVSVFIFEIPFWWKDLPVLSILFHLFLF